MTTVTAITATSFVGILGINTHIDFAAFGYQNLATVESALNYLGVRNVRDSAQNPADLTSWMQVAQATGVRFDDYMPEGSPAAMQNALSLVNQLASEGILNFIEGGNEEDDDYAISMGNSLSFTAHFQQQVYAVGHALGLPVINMSFGAGWTAANGWQGDYGAVGNLAAYADYGNGHTYPNPGQTPDDAIQMINGLAPLAAAGRPVITTEIGWDNASFTQAQVAKYVVDAALDGIKDGDVKTYFYALFDDASGQFGLMNADGTPKPAGVALHDLTTLLADNGTNAASFTPGSLTFTLGGTQSTDNSLLIQKSDGSDWLALWDETAAAHTVTLTLPAAAQQIVVFDPVTGTSSIASASNTGTISVSLGNDPLLLEIVPGSGSGGGTGGTGSTGGTGGTTTPSPNPVITVPASETVTAGASLAVSGVSIADPWAALQSGTLALNVIATGGTVSMLDSSGNRLAGSGTSGIHVSGTLSQINAELKTLNYAAGSTAGGGSVVVDIWDQAGVEATKTVGVTIKSAMTTISIAATNANVVENVSNAIITTTSGNHTIFIGGTGDTLVATGGIEFRAGQSWQQQDHHWYRQRYDPIRWFQQRDQCRRWQQPVVRQRQQQHHHPDRLRQLRRHIRFHAEQWRQVRPAPAAGADGLEGRPGQYRKLPACRDEQRQRRRTVGGSDRRDRRAALHCRHIRGLGCAQPGHAADALHHLSGGPPFNIMVTLRPGRRMRMCLSGVGRAVVHGRVSA